MEFSFFMLVYIYS